MTGSGYKYGTYTEMNFDQIWTEFLSYQYNTGYNTNAFLAGRPDKCNDHKCSSLLTAILN